MSDDKPREETRYRPASFEGGVDPERCRAAVYGDYRHHQCSRKARVAGEWCKQHAPGAADARREREHAKYTAKREQRAVAAIAAGLRGATVAQLRAELAKRSKAEHMEKARRA